MLTVSLGSDLHAYSRIQIVPQGWSASCHVHLAITVATDGLVTETPYVIALLLAYMRLQHVLCIRLLVAHDACCSFCKAHV